MKICKICKKEITNKKRWVYCSDECSNLSWKNYRINERQKNFECKKTWDTGIKELNKIKHNRKVPINKLGLTSSVSTYIKWLIKDYGLTTKEYIKMKRSDSITKDYLVVVVAPEDIKTIFHDKYEKYKQSFRFDSLGTIKTLVKVFDKVNDYYKKENNEK